jgi:hypothetical protein
LTVCEVKTEPGGSVNERTTSSAVSLPTFLMVGKISISSPGAALKFGLWSSDTWSVVSAAAETANSRESAIAASSLFMETRYGSGARSVGGREQ